MASSSIEESDESSSPARLLQQVPRLSESHAYEDADVRILVNDTIFLVHTVMLMRNSDYFMACFNGPWGENTVDGEIGRQVTFKEVESAEFAQLLDWIYCRKHFIGATKAFALKDIAERFQVTTLLEHLNLLCIRNLSWKNIESWLQKATGGTMRYEGCIKSCVAFLAKAPPKGWIRVWYLAEKYDLPKLRDRQNFRFCSKFPQQDPYFELLSVFLQRDLLDACLTACVAFVDLYGDSAQTFRPLTCLLDESG
ncbi:hypothetical protein BDZ88DRAFT_449527 [Geranomyces variabilis]|nr:hypothetical protein BDZ88DRAFT_449527 [Geranomyces variabilis]KAJ3142175.1 hypothetical protein HDU90_004448 [Geranomyces variabilis]